MPENTSRSAPQTVDEETELERAHQELQDQYRLLVQSEKMATMGLMTAGVAHEIKNPMAFVISNLDILKDYSKTLLELVKQFESLETARSAGDTERANGIAQEIGRIKKDEGFEDILEDWGAVLTETISGAQRIKKIVGGLASFVRKDDGAKQDANLIELLEQTLRIANNEIKYKCTVTKNFETIPPIRCHAGQLSQVFLNLLINSSHAIEESGQIELTAKSDGDWIVLLFHDTGSGIDEPDLEHIFEPLFTTKPAGKGTGLGLAISKDIMEGHGGTIAVESVVGQGTTFTLRLPIQSGLQAEEG